MCYLEICALWSQAGVCKGATEAVSISDSTWAGQQAQLPTRRDPLSQPLGGESPGSPGLLQCKGLPLGCF